MLYSHLAPVHKYLIKSIRTINSSTETDLFLLPPASCLLPPASCLLPPTSCLLPPASCLLPLRSYTKKYE
ncbi:MAG: hypothetical protein F6K41_23425 [Symploca sp. SIO3E6]|nr:hypothetical protein [Caldora sp. SIO3E6]